jgi:hypothetical protein
MTTSIIIKKTIFNPAWKVILACNNRPGYLKRNSSFIKKKTNFSDKKYLEDTLSMRNLIGLLNLSQEIGHQTTYNSNNLIGLLRKD